MKPATAAAPITSQAIGNGDSADRILKIVHNLQQQVKDQDARFQAQLAQAVEEARETTRKEVTRCLLNRFHIEVSQQQAVFDRRLKAVIAEHEGLEKLKIESAVAAGQESLQDKIRREARSEYESKLCDAEKSIAQLKEEAQSGADRWRAERQQFQERITTVERALDAANAVRTETLDEYKELKRKLEETSQSKQQLQLDLQRAVSELNCQPQSGPKDGTDHAVNEVAAIVQAEMIRVRLHLDEIGKTLSDPATELGVEIRLNRTRSELEAYLKGLRYSLGEVTLESSTVQDSCKV